MQIRCLAQKRFCPGSYQPGGTPITCCLAWVPGGSSAAATALSTGLLEARVAIFASWPWLTPMGRRSRPWTGITIWRTGPDSRSYLCDRQI